MAAFGLDGTTAVEILDELKGKGLCIGDGRHILKTQFFDLAILQSGDAPINASFGLRGVGEMISNCKACIVRPNLIMPVPESA